MPSYERKVSYWVKLLYCHQHLFFSMKAYIYSVTAQSRKPRSKRSSYVFLVNFHDLHKKNSGLYGMTNTQLVWRKIYYINIKIYFALSRAWYKEKIQSHYEESNLRPLDSVLRCSIPMSHRDSTVSEVYYDMHPAYC